MLNKPLKQIISLTQSNNSYIIPNDSQGQKTKSYTHFTTLQIKCDGIFSKSTVKMSKEITDTNKKKNCLGFTCDFILLLFCILPQTTKP